MQNNNEQYINTVRDRNHTLRNRLIAIQGFCELIHRIETKHLEKYMQDIQLKVTHSAHITKEVSIKLSAASNANDTNQQKFIIESLKHDLNNQRDAVHELKASTQLFLSNIETNHEKTISYKQKIQTILDLVDSLLE